jgi:hypothetical protein
MVLNVYMSLHNSESFTDKSVGKIVKWLILKFSVYTLEDLK